MFKRKPNRQNRFKRLLLKVLNLHALDKETFNLVNPQGIINGENFFDLNKRSYILSSGYLDLKRKIKSLDIYYRYSPEVDLWNSSGSWKRIIPGINKKMLIKVCLLSLKISIENFLKDNSLKINLNLIFDNSSNQFNDEINKLMRSDMFQLTFTESNVKGNRGSFLECCDQSIKAEDLIFFVEDDYLFKDTCIDEVVFSYSRISTLLDRDVFLCPTDYSFYYDSIYKTALFIGKNNRWRYVNETLLTFIFSKNILDKYMRNIKLVGEHENDPFEKPLDDIYSEVPCLAPITSLSYHLSRTVPGIESDWLDLWKYNYNKLKSDF